jgi:hypothetical protein
VDRKGFEIDDPFTGSQVEGIDDLGKWFHRAF